MVAQEVYTYTLALFWKGSVQYNLWSDNMIKCRIFTIISWWEWVSVFDRSNYTKTSLYFISSSTSEGNRRLVDNGLTGLVELSVDSTLILYNKIADTMMNNLMCANCTCLPGGLSQIRVRECGAWLQTRWRVDKGWMVEAILIHPVAGGRTVEVFNRRVLAATGDCSIALQLSALPTLKALMERDSGNSYQHVHAFAS